MTCGPVIRRRSVFADRLLEFSDFTFSDDAALAHRGAWREFFGARIGDAFDGRVIVEIGCNDARLIENIAARYPTTAFVGIDWKCRALHSAAERLAVSGLRNIALLQGRGQDVRRVFADGELDEAWVFHPDPCDKPRELRNRLIAEPFLLDVNRVLRDGGALFLKTDHPGYYQGVLGLFGVPDVSSKRGSILERFELSRASADFWNDESIQAATAAKCFAGEATVFERRYMRKRHPIYYAEIRKRQASSNGTMAFRDS